MFGKAPERRMLKVRGILLLLWCALIVSLFWDPVTIHLTQPDSGTPFAIKTTPVTVQGQVLEQKPYAMGARIFWTMILPLVPMFLMIFGHEAWRRICPLSLSSRLPYYLGLQWIRKIFNRQTGKIERRPMTIAPDSFLARWHFPLQFIFLSSGVTARLLFINSDRWVLGAFFIFIITFAIIIGILYGGKTWCNYFCPIAPMQRIYTSPRGILESKAHAPKQTVSQAMCRTEDRSQKTDDGKRRPDVSACVACATPCPDIDLERTYWETYTKPGARFSYYGYFGMVLMFYVYYYLYSGGWDYYFSGAWTHEENAQLNQLTAPGFFILGQLIDIPKIIAAPLAMFGFIILTYLGWMALEWLYTLIARKVKPGIGDDEIRHHMLMVCAWATFNTFYLFAGRPNINLMPLWLQVMINSLVLTVSTVWMVRNIVRTASDHTDESLAAALRGRLKQSAAAIKELTRGKSVDELSAAEVNLLAKVVKTE
jgi:polyferredoxin